MSRRNDDPGYILLRRMNWGWVSVQMLLTMAWIMNVIGMIYFTILDEFLGLIFMANFMLTLILAVAHYEKYESVYERIRVRKDDRDKG